MSTEREACTPARRLPGPTDITTDAMLHNAREMPDHAAFARRTSAGWSPVSWKEFAAQATALAAGLVTAGIRPGDRVAIMSGTSYEWVRADYAIWLAGAVTVPVYETSAAAQVSWILRDSGAVAAFAADGRLQRLVMDAAPVSVRQVWRLTDVLPATDAAAAEVERRRLALTADSLATIVYTSGTTGRAKGCRLSHGNLVSAVRSVVHADGIREQVIGPHTSVLLFLPLAHILARVVQLIAVHTAVLTAHTSDLPHLSEHLGAFRPTLVLAVPRVFEKFHDRAERAAVSSGRGRLFHAAERVAIAYSRSLDGAGPRRGLRLRHRFFELTVYRRLRAALGGRVRHAVSGGAPLPTRLAHFLRGIGLTVLEGYGLTETAAGVTFNLPDAQRIGTVGRPLPGCRVRIADDGEVLVKGANVFSGYWRNDRATAEVIDESGWFHTGDLGELADGYLSITGRRKDLIVTSSGKNVAPAPIEDRVRAHQLIDQCVVVGDNRPFVTALLTIDRDALSEWRRSTGKREDANPADLVTDADLLRTVQALVDEANREVSQAESIRGFHVLSAEFTVNEELTPTEKVRRERVLTKYADVVESMYAQRSPDLGPRVQGP
jgi:long-chain acyl-CoA synthetase